MTKQALRLAVCACLSLGAAWGGRVLALRLHRDRAMKDFAGTMALATPRTVAGSAAVANPGNDEDQGDPKLAARRAAARCTTQALWEMMCGEQGIRQEVFEATAEELLDREGPAAVGRCETLEPHYRAVQWTAALLEALMARDSGKALELYKTLPEGLTAPQLPENLLKMATENSAASLIATLDALGRSPAEALPSAFILVQYPPDFDFHQVLDYLERHPDALAAAPLGLVSEWAKHAPLAAVEWARDHPDLYPPDSPMEVPVKQALMAVADYFGPERREALLRMKDCYGPEEREELWSRTGSLHQKVDPELAEIAAGMGSGEVQGYLVSCLSATRAQEVKDPAWAQISADLRESAMARMLADWEKEDPTPSGERARTHWMAALDKACGK